MNGLFLLIVALVFARCSCLESREIGCCQAVSFSASEEVKKLQPQLFEEKFLLYRRGSNGYRIYANADREYLVFENENEYEGWVIGPNVTGANPIEMYHPTCNEDCPNLCTNEWIYWSSEADSFVNDSSINVSCGSTECEDAFIPECLQEEEVSEPYYCDIAVWNGANISDLGICEQKWSDIYSNCPDDLVKETCQKSCNFCGSTDANETGGPADGITEESTESSTDLSSGNATPGKCTLGADYPGATVGQLTRGNDLLEGGSCDLNWENQGKSGLDRLAHFAALPKNPGTDADRYESHSNCGRCIKVKCSCEQQYDGNDGACQPNGKEIIAMVTDSCPNCPNAGDLNLSIFAFSDVTGGAIVGGMDGTWEFIECPSNFKKGPMKLRMKGGTNKSWYAFQPENHKNKVTGMDITINGVTQEMVLGGEINGFWWNGVAGSVIEFPATVEVKNEAGVCATVTLNSEDELRGNSDLVMKGDC